jgi:ATP-dependent exoDNAse (exonuclease V) beta subunit
VRAPVDEAARARITTALDETLFVEAGAGTGKTTQLVGRVVALVEDGVSLASIAAITFTEAAAAELRDRIRERLERRSVDPDTFDQVRRHCAAALDEIDMAAISTLHAFAYRLLAEHAVAAGLPPQIEVLDEVRSQLEFEQRWTAFVDELMEAPEQEAAVVRAHHLGVRIEARYPNQASFRDVARLLGQNWDRLSGLLEAAPPGSPPPVDRTAIGPALDALDALDTTCATPEACNQQRVLRAIRPALEALRHGTDDEACAALGDPEVTRRKGRGGRAHCADPGAVYDALQVLFAAVVSERERLVDDVMRRFGARLARFTVDQAEQRAGEGRLEFHDLLVLARRLVRTDPDARRVLHDRYSRLLLDEFQDTDPIQIELATLVAAVVDGEVDRWQDVDPEPGRLFLVGDAKQSIYGFRRADIRVFMAARERFAGNRPVALTENFRTLPPIIDWVNRFFGAVMHEEPGRQPPYAPLDAFRSAPAADHRPVLMGGPHEDLKAAEIRELEAADVARALADIQGRPDAWPVWDPSQAGWRPARMDDVAVLIPARTSLRFLERALRNEGVRYRVDTGALVYDTQEVIELLAALRVLDDPADGLSLVAALRSPLFGCGDDDLVTYRQAGGRWDLTRRVPDDLLDHPVGRAMTWLADLHRQRWWREPSGLLLAIIEQRRAFELAFAEERPRDVWRRVRFLVDQARLFEESEGGGLRDFLAWAELQRHEAARIHEPVLPEADDRSARIMTIHGAKGLEFPITVVSGLSTQWGSARSGPTVVWDDEGRAAVRLTGSARTDNFDVIADFEAEMQRAERLRLLYVALTRARDHLLITTHHKASGSDTVRSFGQQIELVMGEADGLSRRLDDVLAPPDRVTGPSPPSEPEDRPGVGFEGPATSGARAAWIDDRRRLLREAARPATVSATAVAALGLGSDPEEGVAPVETDDQAVFRRGRAGTAIGRAVHAVLQDGDLRTGTDFDDLARAAASAEAVPWAADEVAARARSATRSDAVRAAVAADRHWRELPVVAPVGPATVEGYVDLLYQEGDELVVVDYKTDRLRGPADVDEKADRYRLQGAAYAVALEQATGLRVRECVFVFATEDDPVERTVADLGPAKAEVRELLASERPLAQGVLP